MGELPEVSTPLRGFFVAEQDNYLIVYYYVWFQPPCGVFLLLRPLDYVAKNPDIVSTPLRGFFVAEFNKKIF
jgi:hypothetical protein